MEPRGTILVVDDDARNRELVRGYLETSYQVLEAENGLAALSLLETQPADLILLDAMMPGLSGFDVCRDIKARTAGTFLPVLILTALQEQGDRNAALLSGADDFLSKPIDRRELSLRVRAFLRIREQERLIKEQLEDLRQLAALKDDLISLIVHDLRNPLTSLIISLEMSRKRTKDPTLRSLSDSAILAANSLRERIEDLLQVRLLEDKQIQPNWERVFLPDLVREAIATIESAGKASSVGISLADSPSVETRADRKLLARAVENLISNALKYSPRGGSVEVAVRPAPEGSVIEVADRGPGIPDPFKENVFEKFGSVEGKRSECRRGYGLGLYMVKLVATAHGGAVAVRDRQDGGAVFEISLPATHL